MWRARLARRLVQQAPSGPVVAAPQAPLVCWRPAAHSGVANAGVSFHLRVGKDTPRGAPPNERWVWFAGAIAASPKGPQKLYHWLFPKPARRSDAKRSSATHEHSITRSRAAPQTTVRPIGLLPAPSLPPPERSSSTAATSLPSMSCSDRPSRHGCADASTFQPAAMEPWPACATRGARGGRHRTAWAGRPSR